MYTHTPVYVYIYIYIYTHIIQITICILYARTPNPPTNIRLTTTYYNIRLYYNIMCV